MLTVPDDYIILQMPFSCTQYHHLHIFLQELRLEKPICSSLGVAIGYEVSTQKLGKFKG